MLNDEEFRYLKNLLWDQNEEFKMSAFRLKFYFQFERLPSELEMNEALLKFDSNLMKAINWIMSDDE